MRTGLKFLIAFLIMAAGFMVRFDDYSVWKKYKEFFFLKDRPFFTSYDGFYYGRLGKEFLEGKFKGRAPDKLRYVPDTIIDEKHAAKYPLVVPLNSFIGAVLTKITGKRYIEETALWLTPFLATLFVIPFIFFMSELGYWAAGVLGAFLGVISQIYVARTSVCRFDTDALNLFFPFAIAYFMLRYLNAKDVRLRYLWVALIGVFSQLYWWWYFHSGLILFMVLVFVVVLLFSEGVEVFKARSKELALLFLVCNPYVLLTGIFNLAGRVKTYVINYFSPQVPSGFPNVLKSISEAKHFSFKVTASITAGNEAIFVVGLLAFLIFIVKRFKPFLLISSSFLIGLMVLKGGNRFGMYLAPFIGAGIGVLVDEGTAYIAAKVAYFRKWRELALFVACAVLISLFFSANEASLDYLAKPKTWPALAADFIKLRDITASDAWIWTWWDFGYAFQYLSERATYHDGGSQLTPKTYFVATTFSTSSPQKAYNVIAGITEKGIVKLRELSEEGKLNPDVSEKLAQEVFEGRWADDVRHSVYWVFTEDLVRKFTWINFFGTWDFRARKGIRKGIFVFGGCTLSKGGSVVSCGRNALLLDKGYFSSPRGTILLKRVVVRKERSISEFAANERGLVAEVVEKGGQVWVYLMEDQPFNSMFNQMYILRNYHNSLFELVYDDFPTMVVYRVRSRHESE